MKRIRLIARQRHLEPKTGKQYSDAKLMTVNAYYEDVFEGPEDFNKTMFLLRFEADLPEMNGWLFGIVEEANIKVTEKCQR